MSASEQPTSLWLWRPDHATWLRVGLGARVEMTVAHAAAEAAAEALGIAAVYRVAEVAPEPMHTARRITIDLPEPAVVRVTDWDMHVWELPDPNSDPWWRIEQDPDSGEFSVSNYLPASTLSSVNRHRWHGYALAILAACARAGDLT